MEKGNRTFNGMILGAVIFLLSAGIVKEAFPHKVELIPISDSAFKVEGRNIRSAKENSILADVVLTNLTGTWFLVTVRADPLYKNVSITEDQIPYVFLMGPYEERDFTDIEFFDEQVLLFDINRTAPAAFAMLSIDMICRGIFSRAFSLDEFDSLLAGITIEGFETAGKELGNDTVGSLLACIAALADGDVSEAIKQFAKFVFTTKEFKQNLWRLIKLIWGEKDSVLKTVIGAQFLKEIIGLIDFKEKLELLTELAVATHKEPTFVDVRLIARGQPFIEFIEPIRITPSSPPYYIDDTLTATFKIVNSGLKSIIFKQLTVGGQGPDGKNDIQDFSPATDIILNPNKTYSYTGTLKLSKPGKHYFTWVYQKPDGQWINRVWLLIAQWWAIPGIIKEINVVAYPTQTSITAYSLTPITAKAGDILTIKYTINNPTSESISVVLGCSIQKSGTATWISDPNNDKVVNVTSGSGNYSRAFALPSSLISGKYNVAWGLWNSDFTIAYDLKQSKDALTVTETLPDLIVNNIQIDPNPPTGRYPKN